MKVNLDRAHSAPEFINPVDLCGAIVNFLNQDRCIAAFNALAKKSLEKEEANKVLEFFWTKEFSKPYEALAFFNLLLGDHPHLVTSKLFLDAMKNHSIFAYLLQHHFEVIEKNTKAIRECLLKTIEDNNIFICRSIIAKLTEKKVSIQNIFHSCTEGEPLMLTALKNHISIFTEFVKASSTFPPYSPEGNNILHEIVKIENFSMAIMVVFSEKPQAAMDAIDKRNNAGETPLFIATKQNNLDALKCLVKLGADVKQENDEGKTPLQIAQSFFRTEQIRIQMASVPILQEAINLDLQKQRKANFLENIKHTKSFSKESLKK